MIFNNGKFKICAVMCTIAVVISLVCSLPSAYADDITGDGPVISENYLRGIKEELKCSELKNLYSESKHGCQYNLFDYDGNFISTSNVGHVVSTGDYIRDINGNAYTIVVTGDVDGNGQVDITDTAAIKLHFSKKITLKDAAFEAADTSNDGRISATDYLKIKYHIQVKHNLYDDESFAPDASNEPDTSDKYDESGWTSGWA